MRSKYFVIIVMLSAAFLAPTLVANRTAGPSRPFGLASALSKGRTAIGRGQSPVIVDGHLDPEGIPDDLAYKHFIAAVAVPVAASDVDIRRRDLMMTGIGFSPEDYGAFVGAVRDVRDDLDRIAQSEHDSAAILRNGGLVDAASARAQRNGILMAARDRIRSSLTPDGAAKLHTYIQERVKPRVVVYEWPDADMMRGMSHN